jgi:hypothetical protein
VAVITVGVALARCQIPGAFPGDAMMVYGGYLHQTEHGWPLFHVKRFEEGKWVSGPSGLAYGPATVTRQIDRGRLAGNVATWVMLLASVVLVMERWARGPHGFRQVRLRGVLACVAVIAVLLARWQFEYHQFDDSPIMGGVTELMRKTSRTAFLGEWISWRVRVPLLFAYGCTIYAAGWVVVQIAGRPASALRSLITSASKD